MTWRGAALAAAGMVLAWAQPGVAAPAQDPPSTLDTAPITPRVKLGPQVTRQAPSPQTDDILRSLGHPVGPPPRPRPGSHPSVITNPDWLHKPTEDEMMSFYPAQALRAGLEGHASIHCYVAVTGTRENCRTIEETPAGQGFGEAAIALSSIILMRPATRDGVPTGGFGVNVPIRFTIPPGWLERLLHPAQK